MKRMTQEEMQAEIERLNLQMDEVDRRIMAARQHHVHRDNETEDFDETSATSSHRTLIIAIILMVLCILFNIYH
jgi:hypothetical protein